MKTPPRHIAVIVNYFPTVSETFIVNQINSLIDLNLQISLYSYNQVVGEIVHNSIKRHNLLKKVHYFQKPPISKRLRFQKFIKWTWQHRRNIVWRRFFNTINIFRYWKDAYTLRLFYESQWFLLPYKYELIHAHFGMVGNRIAYLKTQGVIPESVKLVSTFHGYDLTPNNLKNYEINYSHLFKQADALTVNTYYLEGLLKQIDRQCKPCYILPVGLDTSFFKRTTLKKNTEYFDLVFCGKLIPIKGPELAIKMVSVLIKKGYSQVRLHIIGTGMLAAELLEQTTFLGLENKIFFHGSKNQEEVKFLFEQSDLFILPGMHDPETGRAETQGLVIQEAQAMELPVVISDVGGMKYGMLPDESGFIVKEGDLDGFVQAIEKLILVPNLKQEMGLKGRQFVVEHYDNSILIRKLLSIYNQVHSSLD